MNVDEVSIGNMALANLGSPPVQSFFGSSTASRSLNLRYNEARLQALSEAPWNFASMWQVGVPLAITSAPGWSYSFVYPPDALRVFEIHRAAKEEKDIPFKVTDHPSGSGRVIHTNMPSPTFIYTRDKEDVTSFDWDFIIALSWLLAHKIAMPVTKSKQQRDDALKMYMGLIDKAGARTKNEERVDTDITPAYQAAR